MDRIAGTSRGYCPGCKRIVKLGESAAREVMAPTARMPAGVGPMPAEVGLVPVEAPRVPSWLEVTKTEPPPPMEVAAMEAGPFRTAGRGFVERRESGVLVIEGRGRIERRWQVGLALPALALVIPLVLVDPRFEAIAMLVGVLAVVVALASRTWPRVEIDATHLIARKHHRARPRALRRGSIAEVRCVRDLTIDARSVGHPCWCVEVASAGTWIRVAERVRAIDGVAIAGLLAVELGVPFHGPPVDGFRDVDYERRKLTLGNGN